MMTHIYALPMLLCLDRMFEIGICGRLDFSSRFEGYTWFHEGINLSLYCKQDTTNDIKIESPHEGTIVEGSHLLDGMGDKYYFQKNSSVSVLGIKRLSRNDGGIYNCNEAEQNRKYLQVDVLYSPQDKSPHCTSNYGSSVIFDDLRQDYINFTCISDEGNPPVSITLAIIQSQSIHNIPDLTNICTVHQKFDNSRSFNCHMNESLNNTTFLCTVTQQFPSLYTGGYNGSCSFGPLHFLSSFSVTIYESNVTVMEGGGVNLTCTTNVTGVEIKWTGIPTDWEYHVTTSDYFSHMWIKNVKQQSVSEITLQCIGFYGNRNVIDSVNITIEDRIYVEKGRTTVLSILLSLVILVVLGFTCLLGYFAWKHRIHSSTRYKTASDHQLRQNSEVNTITMDATPISSNKNNANNTALKVGDGDERSNSESSNDQLGDKILSNMSINPVYESASIAVDAPVFESNEDQYAIISKQENRKVSFL